MKILITGGKGMLGRTLRRELACHDLTVADLPEWDITDADAFMSKTLAAAPDVVVHCAAMTKVDDCETSRDLAFISIKPGATALLVIPRDPSSLATDLVMPITPALAAA